MNNIKKNTNGFTLVEIIVVLVILAILAAASIPTMLGFVKDAKMKSQIANARVAYIACQAVITEEYANGTYNKDSKKDIVGKYYHIGKLAAHSNVPTTNFTEQTISFETKLRKLIPETDMGNSWIRIDDCTDEGKIEKVTYGDTSIKLPEKGENIYLAIIIEAGNNVKLTNTADW
ncbi:MAG: type II secretion system protein [Proteocatella sp.]